MVNKVKVPILNFKSTEKPRQKKSTVAKNINQYYKSMKTSNIPSYLVGTKSSIGKVESNTHKVERALETTGRYRSPPKNFTASIRMTSGRSRGFVGSKMSESNMSCSRLSKSKSRYMASKRHPTVGEVPITPA